MGVSINWSATKEKSRAVVESIQLADYDALRGYAGAFKSVNITGYSATSAPSGIAGLFTRDDSDITSADNGGTIIVASNGKRWKRVFDGPVCLDWFSPTADGVANDTSAFDAAISTGKAVFVTSGKTYAVNLEITESYVSLFTDVYRGATLTPYTTSDPIIKVDGDAAGTIVNKLQLKNLKLTGVSRAGHGISVVSTANTRGGDFLSLEDVYIEYCNYGINVAGRSIWNSFKRVHCYGNIDGIHVETEFSCNAWTLDACVTAHSQRHGIYVRKTTSDVFLNWVFLCHNSEGNGLDTSQATACGAYLENTHGFEFIDPYFEQNGFNLTSGNSYGFLVTGTYGRFLNISGGWIVDSKYPIYVDGTHKSGYIGNTLTAPSGGATVGVTVAATYSTGTAKLHVDEKSIQGGSVSYTVDVNGTLAARAVDWIATPGASLNFSYVDNLTVNSAGGAVNISTLTGLQPGRRIVIINQGANNITIAGALMTDGAAEVIAGNSAMGFIVAGYPNAGKLIPL